MMADLYRWTFRILIGCAGIFWLLGAAAPGVVEGSATCSETTYKFGELSETVLLTHTFIVKNTGASTLNIKDVKPDCGCTIARFDRTIPPGGEGKVTLELDLKSFQGYVKKSAKVLIDDPGNPPLFLYLEGTVRPLIEVRPEKSIYFQGMAEELTEKTIDLVSTSRPFHIVKVDDGLEKKAGFKLETVEDGKQYRLKISNSIPRGTYRGTITLHTDCAEKPELTIWVNGFIEGEIGIRPKVLMVGLVYPDQGVVSGKVFVVDNKKKPFKIVKCIYDERLLTVSQSSLPDNMGFSLEVKAKMEGIPAGKKIQTPLTLETDVDAGEKLEVQVQAFNLPAVPN